MIQVDARTIAERAAASLDVEAAVARSLGPSASRATARPAAKTTILAVGKGAPRMTLGALGALRARGAEVARTIVVTTDGTDARGLDGIFRAAHPLPDERSVAAAELLLDAAAAFGARVASGADEELVVLVSGGASSLACAPLDGVPLEKKRAIVDRLLRSGAPIESVNLVRRHLSRIKGGGLLRAVGPGARARMHTRIASDVLVREGDLVRPGAPHEIGSGPSCLDPTSGAEALEALRRFLPDEAESWASILTRRPDAPPVSNEDDVAIVVSPMDLARAAITEAARLGYAPRLLPSTLGSIDEVAASLWSSALALRPGEALLAVGEPTVEVPRAHGAGGRAGRLALQLWSRGLPDGVAFVALASDGVDGSSGNSGAFVAGPAPAGAEDALDRFADGPFLARHGAAMPARPSGLNVLDLHLLVRARAT